MYLNSIAKVIAATAPQVKIFCVEEFGNDRSIVTVEDDISTHYGLNSSTGLCGGRYGCSTGACFDPRWRTRCSSKGHKVSPSSDVVCERVVFNGANSQPCSVIYHRQLVFSC